MKRSFKEKLKCSYERLLLSGQADEIQHALIHRSTIFLRLLNQI